MEQLSVLAVVPARGGSTGIPRKNLQPVGTLSLIARTAKLIGELPWITQAVISTDSLEMKEEGVKYGLGAPFMRPPELAGGEVPAHAVLFHAWVESERYFGTRFEYALYLEPTSPLRRASDVERTFRSLVAGDWQSAATVSRMPAQFTPEKCHVVQEGGLLEFYLPKGRHVDARQQIAPYYFRNGVAYALRREPFFASRTIIGDRTLAVIIDRPTVNIDEPFELELADWLLSRERKTDQPA